MDIEATSKDDRPSYVYQTTVHGSVAALAQGGSTVGSVQQTLHNEAQSAELIGLVREALSKIDDASVRQASLEALSIMGAAKTPASKLEGYKSLIASLSDHMTVLTPFLPALTSLLSGN